ncbi:MAG TPA: class I SAM-dependent methyltransferase, partial [Thermoleophilaceae bacterium]|nr:class I SAM-dependent methyltransferase [Thermoleophilaceae bacterium]
ARLFALADWSGKRVVVLAPDADDLGREVVSRSGAASVETGSLEALPDGQYGGALVAGTLEEVSTGDVLRALRWLHDHLDPGAQCVLVVETYLSAACPPLRTPFAHLLFAGDVVDHRLASQGAARLSDRNPMCRASYLVLAIRAGLEVASCASFHQPLEQVPAKLAHYAHGELACGRFAALLLRPADVEQRLEELQAVRRSESVDVAEKSTQEWGALWAEGLWESLYRRFDPTIDGQDVLDLGCNWGYLLKLITERFRPRRLVGVDLHPMWEVLDHGWSYGELPNVELHDGVFADIEAIGPASIDLILSTSTLQMMGPEELERNLAKAYEVLRPGGEMLLRTRVATSYIGADLHARFDLPYAHLLHPGPVIERSAAEAGDHGLPELLPYTASTYLALFARAGFEAVEVRRLFNRDHGGELEARVRAALPGVADEERRCMELEARLVKPIDPADVSALAA